MLITFLSRKCRSAREIPPGAMAKIVYVCARFTRLKKRLPQIYCWKERLGTFGVSVTPLSLKLDYSNFVQNYFGIRSIFCDKENPDQIDNDVTMTSSFLC